MKQRWLAFGLAAVIGIGVAGCDGDATDDGTPNPSTGESGAPLNDDAIGPGETQAEPSGG